MLQRGTEGQAGSPPNRFSKVFVDGFLAFLGSFSVIVSIVLAIVSYTCSLKPHYFKIISMKGD